ncbi:hypothetical protein H4R33_000224 [Dimargaris cristalligena]|uniref:Extracellular membrane protein CFEM domain-containing protein n=1 Tax=Dimargaris cristalligena TaxID=215637 RepID=A0A4P9ZQA5_9FUNG|nr:hypothetical protein H4R33_000224 [Dimargaris cristalligena]RKP35573.1 hypothetical protein BJ085DRAFT_30865 [Dimargaris cristalligena]|eukprot:RKP35573.1 hypothetical protein BJ085DRAFT_30865 [Dimargaris cristalligena]
MKFALVLAALATAAFAQNSTEPATTTAEVVVPTYVPTAEEKCIEDNNCGTDMDCLAACYKVPNPTAENLNKTNECFAKCPETGDINVISQCRDSCINQYYMPTSQVKIPATSAGSKATGTASDAKPSGSSDSSDSDSGAASLVATFALAVPAVAALSQLL